MKIVIGTDNKGRDIIGHMSPKGTSVNDVFLLKDRETEMGLIPYITSLHTALLTMKANKERVIYNISMDDMKLTVPLSEVITPMNGLIDHLKGSYTELSKIKKYQIIEG